MNPALGRVTAFVTGVILALIAIFAAVSSLTSAKNTSTVTVVNYDGA